MLFFYRKYLVILIIKVEYVRIISIDKGYHFQKKGE